MAIIAGAGIAAAGALGSAYLSSQSGSRGGQQQTGGTQTNLRDSAADTFDVYQRRALEESGRVLEPFQGDRTADFTQDQLDAFGNARGIATEGGNVYGTLASQVANNAANSGIGASRQLGSLAGTIGQGGQALLPGQEAAATNSGALAGYGNSLVPGANAATLGLATTIPNTDLSGYMSPYTRAVLDPALRDLYERADNNRNALGASAARNGAFGGSRQAIAEAESERNTQREAGRLSAFENQRAYESALAQFRNDQTAIPGLYNAAQNQITNAQGQQLGAINASNAAIAGRGAVQGQVLAGQTGLQNVANLEASQLAQTSGLANANTARLQSQVNPLLATGGLQQALAQADADEQYRRYVEDRDWQLRNLEVLRGGASIANVGSGSTTTQAAPNATSGALGAGIGAFGALGGNKALQSLFSGQTGTTTGGLPQQTATADSFGNSG